MPIYNGSQKLKELSVDGRKLKEVWTWTGTAWQKLFSSVAAFINSGLQKSGTQLAPSGVWTDVTDWVVREGFAGTVIESHGIRVPAGVAVNWTHSVFMSASPLDQSEAARLINGSSPIPGSTVGNGSYSWPPTTSGTFVGTGEIIKLQVNLNGSSGRRTVAPSTYFEVRRA